MTKEVKHCIDCGKQVVAGPRCYSCAAKKRGCNLTPEQIKANSARMKELWQDPEWRSEQIAKRKEYYATPKGKRQLVEKVEKAWSNPASRKKLMKARRESWTPERRQAKSEWMSQEMRRRWREGVYDGVFHHVSKLEMRVAKGLKKMGIRYEQQFQPDDCHYIYDFYLPEYNMLLEVNGTYWHYSEQAVEKGVPEKDAEKMQWALDHGYDFETFLEEMVNGIGAADFVRQWRTT